MPTLVLLRHGESDWNAEGRFAGWVDVALTAQGAADAVAAAAMLRKHDYVPATIHTSVLSRARDSAFLIRKTLGLSTTVLRSSWRLNERHYGALQGMNKAAVRRLFGDDMFRTWRRSYDIAPPPIEPNSKWDVPRGHSYFGLEPSAIPRSESLADVTRRLLPYWHDVLGPELRDSEVVLLVSHSNALRAVVAFMDGLGDRDVLDLNIPTAQPLVYDLDGDLRPTQRGGRYLAPVAAASAAARVANEGRSALHRLVAE